jgi:hypothetical protein
MPTIPFHSHLNWTPELREAAYQIRETAKDATDCAFRMGFFDALNKLNSRQHAYTGTDRQAYLNGWTTGTGGKA